MHPITVRPRIIERMAKGQYTTNEEMQRMVRSGVVALVADRFMDTIGRTLGSGALTVLDEFYKSFLGEYTYVAEESIDGNFAIRFYHPTDGDAGAEGVQLAFVYEEKHRAYRGRLYRVNTHNGGVALNLLKVFELE